MKKIENTVIGLILIIIGVIIGLNAFHITNIDLFFDGWWTLFIIVPCFFGLFKDQDKTGNIIGLIVGIYLLLYCQGLINFQFAWNCNFNQSQQLTLERLFNVNVAFIAFMFYVNQSIGLILNHFSHIRTARLTPFTRCSELI